MNTMNTQSIIFSLAIVAIAIWFRFGRRLPKLSLPNIKISWSLWGFLWKTLALVAILLIILMLGSCTACAWVKYKQATSPAKVGTKALVLRFDGFTPCDPTFDYLAEVDTQGDPITLNFPGIKEPLRYSGKGTLDLTKEEEKRREPGPVHIVSDDPRKQTRVRIYEIVNIKE